MVTGGSSGIGRSLVRAYAAQGARVLAVARREGDLAATVAGTPDGSTGLVAADLTTDGGRRAVETATEHAWGAVDVVVHAAGTLGPVNDQPGSTLEQYPPDEWYRVFEANVSAVHFLHQRLAGLLARGDHPAVIGVSSTVGRTVRARWGMYAISKAGLEAWLDILDQEWAGMVYSVNPGGTATPMRAAAIPDEDPATIPTPDDVAPLFLRLAHPFCPEPSGSKLDARDWLDADPWEGLRGDGLSA